MLYILVTLEVLKLHTEFKFPQEANIRPIFVILEVLKKTGISTKPLNPEKAPIHRSYLWYINFFYWDVNN